MSRYSKCVVVLIITNSFSLISCSRHFGSDTQVEVAGNRDSESVCWISSDGANQYMKKIQERVDQGRLLELMRMPVYIYDIPSRKLLRVVESLSGIDDYTPSKGMKNIILEPSSKPLFFNSSGYLLGSHGFFIRFHRPGVIDEHGTPVDKLRIPISVGEIYDAERNVMILDFPLMTNGAIETKGTHHLDSTVDQ